MARKKSRKKEHKFYYINIGLLTLYAILTPLFLFYGYYYRFFSLRGLMVVIPLISLLIFASSIFVVWRRKGSWLLSLCLFVILCSMGMSLYIQKSLVDVSQRMNRSTNYEEIEMQILVPIDSTVTNLAQLPSLLTPLESDGIHIKELLDYIAKEEEVFIEERITSSYQESYEKLLGEQEPAMVFNTAYTQLLELIYPNYSSQVKVIYTYKIKKRIEKEQSSNSNADAFNIYISGIDTYGSILSVSRSDVNIILTVNQKTKEILLTTTPRDAYVPIAGGGNGKSDKLTHAGIYGIQSSVETLENLYDIDISYYTRINFTSFLNLIDVLGGIEVYNDQEFTSSIGGFYFPKGMVALNSQEALGFVRERYNLEKGDTDRGRNHNKVVAAILKKLASIKNISRYQEIIDGVGDSIQTDMPISIMLQLANHQLFDNRSYSIRSQSLEGDGTTGELVSYAMPEAQLYMLSIDPTSLETVTQEIHHTLEGK